MKKRLYISSTEAAYFVNNKMLCSDNPPTQGDFIVGDIVISDKQVDGIFGWVCVSSGSPGRWEVICDIVEIKNKIELHSNNIDELIEKVSNGEANVIRIENVIDEINEKIENNTNGIKNINTQVDITKQTLVTLTGQITNNTNKINTVESNLNDLVKVVDDNNTAAEKEIQDIKTIVGLDDNEEQEGLNLLERLDELETVIGNDGTGDDNLATGLYKEINDVKVIISENADNAEEATIGIMEEINELKEFVGLDNAEEGENPSLRGEIEDIKNVMLRYWVGTQTEYDNLEEKEPGKLYMIIDRLDDTIPCTGLSLNVSEVILYEDDEYFLFEAILEPEDCNQSVTWEIDNNDILELIPGTHTCKVIPLTIGNCVITATCGDYTAECTVIVKPEEVPCTAISINPSTMSIERYTTGSINVVSISPSDTTDEVVWTTSNTNVSIQSSSNSKCTIYGKSSGNCVITATCGSVQATCNVNVYVPDVPYWSVLS